MKLKFNIDNKEYFIYWKHYNNTHLNNNQKSLTSCRIADVENNTLSEKNAIMNPHDKNFNKKKGREISLRKALDSMNFTKEQRAYVWKTYFEYIDKCKELEFQKKVESWKNEMNDLIEELKPREISSGERFEIEYNLQMQQYNEEKAKNL